MKPNNNNNKHVLRQGQLWIELLSKIVQFTLVLGSTILCTKDCRFSEQATVGRTHKSHSRAVFIQGDEEK